MNDEVHNIALNQHGGIGGRDAFNLLKHRFQSGTVAYNLLKSSLVRNLTIVKGLHHEDPQDAGMFYRAPLLRAALTLARSTSSSKGLARNSAAPPATPASAFWYRRVR